MAEKLSKSAEAYKRVDDKVLNPKEQQGITDTANRALARAKSKKTKPK